MDPNDLSNPDSSLPLPSTTGIILSDTDFKQLCVLFLLKAAFNFALFIIILAWSGKLLPYMLICILIIVSDSSASGYSIYAELHKYDQITDRREILCNLMSGMTQAYKIIPVFVLFFVSWTHFVALKNVGKTPKIGNSKKSRKPKVTELSSRNSMQLRSRRNSNFYDHSDHEDHDLYYDNTSSYGETESFNNRPRDIQDLGFNQDETYNSAIDYFRKNMNNGQNQNGKATPYNIRQQRQRMKGIKENPSQQQMHTSLAMEPVQDGYHQHQHHDQLSIPENHEEEDDYYYDTQPNQSSYFTSFLDLISNFGWGASALEKSQNPKSFILPSVLLWTVCLTYGTYNVYKKSFYNIIDETCIYPIILRKIDFITASVVFSIVMIPVIYISRSFLEWYLGLGHWSKKKRSITKTKKQLQRNSQRKRDQDDNFLSISRQSRGSKTIESALQLTDMLTDPVDILFDILASYKNFFRLWIWYIIGNLVIFFNSRRIDSIPVIEFNALWIAYIDSYAAYFIISIYPKLFNRDKQEKTSKKKFNKLCISNMKEYSMWTSLFEILHDDTPTLDRKFMIFVCHFLQFMFLGLRVWHQARADVKIKKLIFFSKSMPISLVTWLIGFLLVETYLVI